MKRGCYVSQRRRKHSFFSSLISMAVLLCVPAWSQTSAPKPPEVATKVENPPETPKDTLGRETPRGTVLGFLAAARKGDSRIAALCLNTPLRGASAEALAHQQILQTSRRDLQTHASEGRLLVLQPKSRGGGDIRTKRFKSASTPLPVTLEIGVAAAAETAARFAHL